MAEQPMPTPNSRPSIQGLVRHDLEQREHVGIQRYGTPLQAHNGRDALRDAYEEALDLACYLRQAIEERGSALGLVADGFNGDAIYDGIYTDQETETTAEPVPTRCDLCGAWSGGHTSHCPLDGR